MKSPHRSNRITEALLLFQSLLTSAILFWFAEERQANPFFETWLSENFPLGRFLLQGSVVVAISTLLFATSALVILGLEKGVRRLSRQEVYPGGKLASSSSPVRGWSRRLGLRDSLPKESFYLLIVAFVSLGFSVILESTIIAFIGLGVLFLAFTPFYLRYQEGHPASQAGHSPPAETPVMGDMPRWKIIYVQYPGRPVESYVVSESVSPLVQPDLPDNINESTLRGIQARGSTLLHRLEKALETDLGAVRPNFVVARLPAIIVEKLGLAEDVVFETVGDRFRIKVIGTPYAKECEQSSRESPWLDSLGCEFCGAIALSFAKSSGQPVTIDDTIASASRGTIETTYRILSHERHKTPLSSHQ